MSSNPLAGWEMVAQAAELAQRGEDCALATVVWRQGPSSGQQGSRALVTAAGEIRGWIGGACAEPVVIREAVRVIREREPRLLLLGTPEQFEGAVADGMLVVPIACQSEGAMEVYRAGRVDPHLVVIGRSPMTHTLCDLARVLGWRRPPGQPGLLGAELDPPIRSWWWRRRARDEEASSAQ
jgi:xanthine dehydrogenase accessory factor